MALGKRRDEQQEMWVATTSLPKSQGHVFYRKLNEVFAEAGFDRMAEGVVSAVLSRANRPTVDPAGCVFSHVAGGLLRGPRLATRHRLAVCRQPFAAGIPGRAR